MADAQSTNTINNVENGVQKIALITGITGQVRIKSYFCMICLDLFYFV